MTAMNSSKNYHLKQAVKPLGDPDRPILFDTTKDDTAAVILYDRLATKGYAYMIRFRTPC